MHVAFYPVVIRISIEVKREAESRWALHMHFSKHSNKTLHPDAK